MKMLIGFFLIALWVAPLVYGDEEQRAHQTIKTVIGMRLSALWDLETKHKVIGFKHGIVTAENGDWSDIFVIVFQSKEDELSTVICTASSNDPNVNMTAEDFTVVSLVIRYSYCTDVQQARGGDFVKFLLNPSNEHKLACVDRTKVKWRRKIKVIPSEKDQPPKDETKKRDEN